MSLHLQTASNTQECGVMAQNGEFHFLEPSDEQWVSFVGSSPEANIFHHPQWTELLRKCYGFRPFILAVKDSEGSIRAGIPVMEIKGILRGRRWVSLPFTDLCSPLYRDDASVVRLMEGLSSLSAAQGISETELRWDMPYPRTLQTSGTFKLHKIALSPDLESVSARVQNMHKRNVSVAEKKGVRIEWGSTREHMDAFYQLHLQTRHRQGVPIQPRRFFDLLGRELIGQGLGSVWLAYKDDKCIAATVFLYWQKTLTYKFSASDTELRSLQPSHLLLWTAIRWGCENGFTLLDMGRTDADNEGLAKFKSGWGAEETTLTYCTLSEKASKPSHGGLMKLVRPVIQKSPPWVCRLAGELLYKHFG
jgi:CelD/BcsL family acetyltransferase involved in cellulose biosynthesis